MTIRSSGQVFEKGANIQSVGFRHCWSDGNEGPNVNRMLVTKLTESIAMKPNLLPAVRRIIFPLLAGAALSTLAQVALDPYLAGLPAEQRITQAPVFRDPIIYVGDQPPDAAESEDLWSAIDVMRQHGPAVGIPALELYIQSYSNSVWTPSLRNNLGVYYRNKGHYSLALAHWETAWETTKLADSASAKAVADFALAHYTRLV